MHLHEVEGVIANKPGDWKAFARVRELEAGSPALVAARNAVRVARFAEGV